MPADGPDRLVSEGTRDQDDLAAELRALIAHLTELQDKERRRLAAELHDVVGQTLGALSAELALLRRKLGDAADDEVLAHIERANGLTKQAMRAMRHVKTELHPLGVEVAGWPAILHWYGDAIQSRARAILSVRADAMLPRPAPKVADTLIRIYLEALNNIAKHAGARRIDVALEKRGNRIMLEVCDDGCGFDPSRARRRGTQSGWGMMIMRERAEAIGAVLQVLSNPGGGTRVEVLVPGEVWS